MTGIPSPPAYVDVLELVIEAVDPRRLLRIVRRDLVALRFRRGAGYRFDAPDGSFGVLYAAFDTETAFAETVLRDRPMRAASPTILLEFAELETRAVMTLAGRGRAVPLRLIKLYDEGLVAAHLDNTISSADDYSSTQRWAKALHDHPVSADGIVYMSRFLGARRSVALFERASALLEVGSTTPLLDHPDLARVLDLFNIAIQPP